MANQEQEESGTEEELFYSAFDGDASPAEPEIESEQKPTRERDEHGRFAAKPEPQEQPVAAEPPKQVEAPVEAAAQNEPADETPPAKEEDDAKIPSWRMREIREARDAERAKREEAERRAQAIEAQYLKAQNDLDHIKRMLQQQNQPKQQQPDPIDLFGENGPERFVETVEQRLAREREAFQREIRNVRLESNFAVTHQLNPDVFPQAYQAFEQAIQSGDQVVGHRVFNSSNPGAAMVSWFKEQSAIKEIGGDPASYVQKKLDEALKDPAFLAKALEAARAQAGGAPAATVAQAAPAARPNTVTQLPPSLRSVPGTAASADGTGTQHLSEEELFYSNLRR